MLLLLAKKIKARSDENVYICIHQFKVTRRRHIIAFGFFKKGNAIQQILF